MIIEIEMVVRLCSILSWYRMPICHCSEMVYHHTGEEAMVQWSKAIHRVFEQRKDSIMPPTYKFSLDAINALA